MTEENQNHARPHDSDFGHQRTTNDVRHEVEEALKLFAALQDDKMTTATNHDFSAGMRLQVEIQGADAPLVLPPFTEILIGRADPATGDAPEIDLAPYAAYQMGISRRHALIRFEEDGDGLYLTDLGSRNGTYINGKKAQPQQPVKLLHGDELRLGKMALRVYFLP